jgi:hypothetical protein
MCSGPGSLGDHPPLYVRMNPGAGRHDVAFRGGGRPKNVKCIERKELWELITALGGPSAAAALVGMHRGTLHRYLRDREAPRPVVERLRLAVSKCSEAARGRGLPA